MPTPSLQGAIAEAAITLAALRLGFVVSRPVSDGHRYDLIVDTGTRLWRVQCKSSRADGGTIIVRNRAVRMTAAGQVVTRYGPDDVDAIVGYSARHDLCVALPIAEIAHADTITLRLTPARNGQRAGVRYAADHPLDRLAA